MTIECHCHVNKHRNMLSWYVYFQMMNVFVLQLMCVLMQSQVYSVMTTAARKKSSRLNRIL